MTYKTKAQLEGEIGVLNKKYEQAVECLEAIKNDCEDIERRRDQQTTEMLLDSNIYTANFCRRILKKLKEENDK